MDVVVFFDNHANSLFLLAGLSLVIEITMLALSGPLLFLSLGLLITGTLSHFGVVTNWEEEGVCIGLTSLLAASALWVPFKAFQQKIPPLMVGGDLIGRKVLCVKEINFSCEGSVTYIGAEWPARLDPLCNRQRIQESGQCIISRIDGNKMVVKPA